MHVLSARLRVEAHGFIPPTFMLELPVPNDITVSYTAETAHTLEAVNSLWGETLPEDWVAALATLVLQRKVCFIDLWRDSRGQHFRVMLTARDHAELFADLPELTAALNAVYRPLKVDMETTINDTTVTLVGSPGLFRMGWSELHIRHGVDKGWEQLTVHGRRLFTQVLEMSSRATSVYFPGWESETERLLRQDTQAAMLNRLHARANSLHPEDLEPSHRMCVDHPHLMPLVRYPRGVSRADIERLSAQLDETLGLRLREVL